MEGAVPDRRSLPGDVGQDGQREERQSAEDRDELLGEGIAVDSIPIEKKVDPGGVLDEPDGGKREQAQNERRLEAPVVANPDEPSAASTQTFSAAIPLATVIQVLIAIQCHSTCSMISSNASQWCSN